MIDIIIPTRDNFDYLQSALITLKYRSGYPFRLILVDNSDNRDNLKKAEELIKSLSIEAEIIHIREHSFPKAVNEGLKRVKSKYFVISNDDVRYGINWLKELVRVVKKYPDCKIIAPMASTSNQAIWAQLKYERISFPNDPNWWNDEVAVSTFLLSKVKKEIRFVSHPVAFCCALLHTDLIDSIGMLDEDFGPGLGEDDLYCHKVLRAGWKIGVCLRSYIWHKGRTTFNKFIPNWRQIQARNIALLSKKLESLGSEKKEVSNLVRVKGDDKVYLLEGKVARWITTRDMLKKLGYDMSMVRDVSEDEFKKYKIGKPLKETETVVLYLTWNRLELTKKTLPKLLKRVDADIVIIDNGSTDGTVKYLRRIDNRKIIDKIFFSENKGVGYAMRYFITKYRDRYKYLAKVDNDTVVPEGWPDKLVELLEKHSDVMAIQPLHKMFFLALLNKDWYNNPELFLKEKCKDEGDGLFSYVIVGGSGVVFRSSDVQDVRLTEDDSIEAGMVWWSHYLTWKPKKKCFYKDMEIELLDMKRKIKLTGECPFLSRYINYQSKLRPDVLKRFKA